jgi:hypothetical protein
VFAGVPIVRTATTPVPQITAQEQETAALLGVGHAGGATFEARVPEDQTTQDVFDRVAMQLAEVGAEEQEVVIATTDGEDRHFYRGEDAPIADGYPLGEIDGTDAEF